MAKPTVSQTKQMVEELINLQPSFDRYRELEKAVKENLIALKYDRMEVPGRGRVFISQSERTTVSADLVRAVLDGPTAMRLIRIKEYVPNKLIEAFAEVGDISAEKHSELMAKAEKTPVVSLYVRPLK